MTIKRRFGKKLPTLNDVANLAGVSPKSVSNVVRKMPYVSEGLREKVHRAIETLGYRPSGVARSLVTGRTATIGIVVTDISNPFFGQTILGCEKALDEGGYNIVLCGTDESLERERVHVETITAKGVDGFIIFGGQLTWNELNVITGNNIPFVAIDPEYECADPYVTIVNIENEKGAFQAVQHLIRAGRKRIGHLAGPSHRSTARRREFGYKRALVDAGMPVDIDLIASGFPSLRSGYRTALQLLGQQRLDALFCYNDIMAIGAIVACTHLGLTIPDDVAVVGFDDITMSALVTPALTTVRIAQYELGRQTGALLLERLRGNQTGHLSVTFPTELQVRNSCGTKRISPEEMRDILDSLATSVAVDLPEPNLASGGEEGANEIPPRGKGGDG